VRYAVETRHARGAPWKRRAGRGFTDLDRARRCAFEQECAFRIVEIETGRVVRASSRSLVHVRYPDLVSAARFVENAEIARTLPTDILRAELRHRAELQRRARDF
jgi:hypothetical protein